MGNTPLHIALQTHSILMIKTILNLGADPLIMNFQGKSCIDFAIKLKCSENVMMLLK